MVSLVLREHFFKVLTVLRTEDGISKGRVSQLNFSVRDLLHKESSIVQIYRITDLIVPCRFLLGRFFHDLSRLCRRCFRLNCSHSCYGLTDFLKVVIGKPFIVKVFRYTLRVNIVSAGLLIPDGILAILGIDNSETLVDIFQRICLGSFDCLSLGFFFRGEIATFLHQGINSLCHLRPRHLHIIAAAFVITDTLGIVIFTAVRCTGTGMGMTACTILML